MEKWVVEIASLGFVLKVWGFTWGYWRWGAEGGPGAVNTKLKSGAGSCAYGQGDVAIVRNCV